MNVVPMSRYRSRGTVQVLEALVAKARRGEVVGVALCFRTEHGFEDSAITGSYAESTDLAAAAAMRLSMRLATANGEYDRPP
jgi:hypothetical protein